MKVSGGKISENRDAIPSFLGACNPNVGLNPRPKGAGWKPW